MNTNLTNISNTSIRKLHSASRTFVSPPIYYGWDEHSDKWYSFRDSNGVEHIIKSFDDAIVLLKKMYTKILNSFNIKVENLENHVHASPNGQYAYFSLKI